MNESECADDGDRIPDRGMKFSCYAGCKSLGSQERPNFAHWGLEKATPSGGYFLRTGKGALSKKRSCLGGGVGLWLASHLGGHDPGCAAC